MERIVFQIDEEMKDAIDDYCDRTSQMLSEYVRNLIREDLINKGIINIFGGE